MPTAKAKVTNLRMALLNDGRPQYIIAAIIGFSPARLSEYAMGKRAIPMHHLYGLCEELHLNPDQLLGWADDAIDEVLEELA